MSGISVSYSDARAGVPQVPSTFQRNLLTFHAQPQVLDDYAQISPKHFDPIKDIKVSYWDQTLNPAKEDDLQALIRRLEPYGKNSNLHTFLSYGRNTKTKEKN